MTIGSESESSDSRLSQTIGQSRYLSRPGSGSESESDSDGLAGPARRRSESDYWPVPGLRDYWPGSESESGETIGRGVRVRRRDHQLDYRAVPESDYWRVPRRPAETDYRPVAGPDYWRVPRPADTIGDCRPARLLAPSPGRICNDSRSRGQRLDLQLFIKFVGWESLIHHRIINRIV